MAMKPISAPRCLGSAAMCAQRLGGGTEQDVVDHSLVLVRDGGDFLRHGEDDVEVFDRQKFGLTVLEPLCPRERLALRAMPVAAAVEGDALVAAGIALFDVAAERGGTTAFDGAHDTTLPTAERVSVILTVGRADLAEDVRHLQPGRAQRAPSEVSGRTWMVWRGRKHRQQVQRADSGADGGVAIFR